MRITGPIGVISHIDACKPLRQHIFSPFVLFSSVVITLFTSFFFLVLKIENSCSHTLVRVFALVFTVRSPEGKLSLYCKGADTIIYERLHQSCSKLMDVTTEHLNVNSISIRSSMFSLRKDKEENYRDGILAPSLSPSLVSFYTLVRCLCVF